jgi:hypothetical protein
LGFARLAPGGADLVGWARLARATVAHADPAMTGKLQRAAAIARLAAPTIKLRFFLLIPL